MRNVSQNVLFYGKDADEYDEHPFGFGIAQMCHEALTDEGYELTAIDSWRGCGWSFFINDKLASLKLVVAATETDLWMLQIGSANDPGWISRLLGRKTVDHADTIFKIAFSVHELLLEYGFTKIQWTHDDYPSLSNSTDEPVHPDHSHPLSRT